jgi:hypothetical protein
LSASPGGGEGALKKSLHLLWLFCGLIFASAPLHAEPNRFTGVELRGPVEVLDHRTGRWREVSGALVLRSGEKIRTGEGAYADLALNGSYEGLLRLDGNSRMAFLDDSPWRISLDEGVLMVLREENPKPALRILTHDFVAEVETGGFVISTGAEGVTARVFGESLTLVPMDQGKPGSEKVTVTEGFSWNRGKIRRMDFEEYQGWQRWHKGNDVIKDSRNARESAESLR